MTAVYEEFEGHQDRSGEPEILMSQSIVLGEIKTQILLQNEKPFESSNSMTTVHRTN